MRRFQIKYTDFTKHMSELMIIARFIQVELDSDRLHTSAEFHFFNAFFYKKLTEKSETNEAGARHHLNHERVRKWTKVDCTL